MSADRRMLMARRIRSTRRGFTLLEGLIAAMILSFATLAVLMPVMASHQQEAAVDDGGQALALARQLMEEITARPFADPTDGNNGLGPGPTETSRDLFDNVDDYHGYTDTTSSLKTTGGSTVAVSANGIYTRTVKVEFRATPAGAAVVCGDFALVTVTVTSPKGQMVALSQLVTRVPLKR